VLELKYRYDLAAVAVVVRLHLGHGALEGCPNVAEHGHTLPLGQVDQVRPSAIVVLDGRHSQLEGET